MKWVSCIVCAFIALSSISWFTSPVADAGRSLAVSTQSFPLSGSETRKWYPISDAIFGWSRTANKDEEAVVRHFMDKSFTRSRVAERPEEEEERHPADKLLRKRKADVTESYILGGY